MSNDKKKANNYSSPILKELLNKRDKFQTNRVRNQMIIAAKIDDLLKKNNWSKGDLAEKMGKSPSMVTRWLSGTHNFTSDTLSDLQTVFGENFILKTDKVEERKMEFQPIKIVVNQPVKEKTSDPIEMPLPEGITYNVFQNLIDPMLNTIESSNFNLIDIALLETELRIPTKPDFIGEVTRFLHHVTINYLISVEKSDLRVFVNVNVVSEEGNVELGRIKTALRFNIENLEPLLIENNPNSPFDEEVTEKINDFAVSTTRGIMFMEFKGTILHKAFLPYINLSQKEPFNSESD